MLDAYERKIGVSMPTTSIWITEIGPSISVSSSSQRPNTIKASRIPLGFNFTPPTTHGGGSSSRMSGGGFGSEGGTSRGGYNGGNGGGFSGSDGSHSGGSRGCYGGSTRPLSSSNLVLNSLLQNMG